MYPSHQRNNTIAPPEILAPPLLGNVTYLTVSNSLLADTLTSPWISQHNSEILGFLPSAYARHKAQGQHITVSAYRTHFPIKSVVPSTTVAVKIQGQHMMKPRFLPAVGFASKSFKDISSGESVGEACRVGWLMIVVFSRGGDGAEGD
jgi:hypothetical protein